MVVVVVMQDLVNMEKKKKLLVSLNKMKAALPLFSRAMQSYVKSKTPQSKVESYRSRIIIMSIVTEQVTSLT